MRSWCMALLLLCGLHVPLVAQDHCGLLNPGKCGVVPQAIAGTPAVLDPGIAASPVARVASAILPKLIGDLDLTFTSFDTENAAASGVGVSYDWGRRITTWDLPDNSANVSAFSWNLNAEGNVAFDAEVNPRDFLKSGTTLGWLFSRGGVVRQLPLELSQRLQNDILSLALVPTDSLATHPLNRSVLSEISEALSEQVFVSLDAQAAYESDQRFVQKQLTYGGRAGIDIKAWNPSSLLARLNVLDWPFALTRYLTGVEDRLQPRGSALPTVLFSLDRVHPVDDTLRTSVGAGEAFARFAFEAGFRTLAGRVASGQLFAEANVRYYREIGPEQAIVDLGIDEAFLFVVSLTGPGGAYVSYSSGELPFDRRSDRVYGLGFRYRI